ncbi:MAG: DNA repair protein RadA [Prolixibacteraceae bacterium]|nr:DNA repair protein RadA [Prolixibacteraceae bacterium]
MAVNKLKTTFLCQDCGAESPKWIGKCPVCGQWNSYVEEVVEKSHKIGAASALDAGQPPIILGEIPVVDYERINVGIDEFNRVLGGGLVPGSVVLIGGEPGIGKSTLVLQLSLLLKNKKILYSSGEESLQQIKLRAERLKIDSPNCLFLSETSLEVLLAQSRHVKPDVLIVDSIQTLSTEMIDSSPGSVTQVRECATAIMKYAKQNHIAVLLIGHINKEGSLAGPKVLEHIVDTVVQFEGDMQHLYRILRATKNRFGSTSEIGIFEMRQEGLMEIKNPSEHLIPHTAQDVSGTAIAAVMEGVRPFLLEIQALVSSAAYGVPQRSSTGFDLRRLNMLLAVLEKRVGFKLASKDVFLNVAGGMRITDPSTDLAVLVSVLSSNLDVAVDHRFCFAGEVGLTGEIRAVNRINQRISEAARLGFKRIFVPLFNKDTSDADVDIKILKVARVEDVFKSLFR